MPCLVVICVVWYEVVAVRNEPFEVENRVHRRFRDFYWLYDQLRSAFKGLKHEMNLRIEQAHRHDLLN